MVVTRLVTHSALFQNNINYFSLLRFSLNKRRRRALSSKTPIFIGSNGIFEKHYPKSSHVSQSTTPTMSMSSVVSSPQCDGCQSTKATTRSPSTHFTGKSLKAAACSAVSKKISTCIISSKNKNKKTTS